MTRELNDLALACGRHFLSSQTGYLHHYYHSQESDVQHTIPIYENVLFALALLRTKTVENMTEGMALLEKLLAFQNKEGQFPIYVHEYPNCKDLYLGIRLLAPFYWILKHFGHVLGADLKQKMEHTIRLLLSNNQTVPYSIAVREAAAQHAFGLLFQNEEWTRQGSNRLDELCQQGHVDSWHSTDYLADLLIGLQMVYSSLLNSPWKDLWHYINQTWHPLCHTYVGPNVREEQAKEEPSPRVYDLFLGYFSGQFPSRVLNSIQVYQLQAALIQPTEDRLELPMDHLEGFYRGNGWMLYSKPEWACTLLNKNQQLDPINNRTYTPFRLVWGDLTRVHTLVCQGSEILVNYQAEDPSTIDLIFTLPEGIDLENRDKQREVNFFLDLHPEAIIKVNSHAANTFEMGQTVTIESGKMKISIQFSILEGSGQFLGHLMRSNRPSQICAKGQQRFNAYDWHLAMRTIRRQGVVRLAARIHLSSS